MLKKLYINGRLTWFHSSMQREVSPGKKQSDKESIELKGKSEKKKWVGVLNIYLQAWQRASLYAKEYVHKMRQTFNRIF